MYTEYYVQKCIRLLWTIQTSWYVILCDQCEFLEPIIGGVRIENKRTVVVEI